MKAIVNTKKSHTYSKYNGLTFEILEIIKAGVKLKIGREIVYFQHTDIIIVDLQNALDTAMASRYAIGCEWVQIHENLESYYKANRLDFKTIINTK